MSSTVAHIHYVNKSLRTTRDVGRCDYAMQEKLAHIARIARYGAATRTNHFGQQKALFGATQCRKRERVELENCATEPLL